MADGSATGVASLKGKVSAEEWRTRVDLAALYRLVALYGWDDLIANHITARVPGPDGHCLINPYGLMFDEMTASAMVKIDLQGNILQETSYEISAAGFNIHAAVHAAREDARFVIHLHTNDGAAVAGQSDGLLPISQHAMIVLQSIAYHDYEGIALNPDERERLVADLADKDLMLLRNHGTLAVGPTAGACWHGMYYLERACQIQIRALTAGRGKVQFPSESALAEVRERIGSGSAVRAKAGATAWPACLRKLDRVLPGYAA